MFQGRDIDLGISDGLFAADIIADADLAAGSLYDITVFQLSDFAAVLRRIAFEGNSSGRQAFHLPDRSAAQAGQFVYSAGGL